MILKNLNGEKKNFLTELNILLKQRKIQQNKKIGSVKTIIENVRKNKDIAILEYEKKFSRKTKISKVVITGRDIGIINL